MHILSSYASTRSPLDQALAPSMIARPVSADFRGQKGRHILSLVARHFSSSSFRLRNGPYDILFCGSDQFSIASLQALIEAEDVWKSIRVLTPSETRPRKASGKDSDAEGSSTHLSVYAEKAGFPANGVPRCVETRKTRTQDAIKQNGFLKAPILVPQEWLPPPPFTDHSDSSVLITASFGYILPNEFLSRFKPEHRLNVHPSLLPRWRGAAPIQWTIINHDEMTGVTVQRLVEKGKGIDGGDIVGVQSGISVPEEATYDSLLLPLAKVGGRLLVDVLRRNIDGTVVATRQNTEHVTRAPKISRTTSHLRWLEQSAPYLARLHRAIGHRYPLWAEVNGKAIQFLDMAQIPTESVAEGLTMRSVPPGTAYLDKSSRPKRMLIACVGEEISATNIWDHKRASGQGYTWAEVLQVKEAGRNAMPVGDWWNGLPPGQRNRNWVYFKARHKVKDDEELSDEPTQL